SLNIRRFLATGAVAVLGTAMAACGASGGDEGTAIIAAPLALTGPAGSVGLDVQQGAELAIEHVNEAGGVGGRQLRLVVEDTAGEPAQAVQLVTSFSKDDN